MAAKATSKDPFPRIGLQCPYCGENQLFESTQSVMHHLEMDHAERLQEVIGQRQDLHLMEDAAKWVMMVHDVPLKFDDRLIYCCPFTKNKVCHTKCFVNNAKSLMEHLQSFHALHRDDAQFIINILRFIELKPVWGRWRKTHYRERRQRRLWALLKYRGAVRRGFVKKYVYQYNREYEGRSQRVLECDGKRDGTGSVLMNEKLFSEFRNGDGIGIDQQVFEFVIHRAIVAKYGHNNFAPDEQDGAQFIVT